MYSKVLQLCMSNNIAWLLRYNGNNIGHFVCVGIQVSCSAEDHSAVRDGQFPVSKYSRTSLYIAGHKKPNKVMVGITLSYGSLVLLLIANY